MSRNTLVIAILVATVAAPQLAHADDDYLCELPAVYPSPVGEGNIYYEAGPAVTHFVPATTYTPTEAVGGEFRALGVNGPWHVGFEFDYAELAGTSRSTARDALGSVIMMPVLAQGTIASPKLLVGRRTDVGPFTLGGELAAGLQVAYYSSIDSPMDQVWTLIEVHADAALWLSPRFTIAAQTGIDVLNPDLTRASLLVGYHMRAYDGRRR